VESGGLMGRKDKPGRTKRRSKKERTAGGSTSSDEWGDGSVFRRTVFEYGVAQHMARYRMFPTQYGSVRQCRYRFVQTSGKEYVWWAWDPTWRMETVPDGAVIGDISRQDCGAYGEPAYWYVDLDRRCVQCREGFVFSASEQKRWREVLGFHESSVAIRCRSCRKQRRSVASLREGMAVALRATEERPQSAEAWLDLARATDGLRSATGAGSLDRGLKAARKAKKLGAGSLADLLEARLQVHAGRAGKAKEVLIEALQGPVSRKQRKPLEGLLRGLE
jgi:hypothetical protein